MKTYSLNCSYNIKSGISISATKATMIRTKLATPYTAEIDTSH